MNKTKALKKLAGLIRRFGKIHVPEIGDLTVKDLTKIEKKEVKK